MKMVLSLLNTTKNYLRLGLKKKRMRLNIVCVRFVWDLNDLEKNFGSCGIDEKNCFMPCSSGIYM